MRRLAMLAALWMVTGCGDGGEDRARANLVQATKELSEANEQARLLLPATAARTAADEGRICRAAVGSLNGRDPAIIKVISATNGLYRVRYTRDDATVWTNDCRFVNDLVEWRMVENGQPGRWRTEDTIRYTINGPTISINSFMGGELMTSDTYRID